MNYEKVLLTYGALLHDVGKVVIRGISEQGTHSRLGADFLKDIIGGDEQTAKRVTDQLRYHHAKELSSANLESDSFAYITYFADNISAGMDRKNEGEDSGFDPQADLQKIFNILCGHHDSNTIPHDDYNAIREEIRKELKGIEPSKERIGSILNLLEATCSSVPSSTDKSQLMDISLFDHLKTTAAIAACIYDYLGEKGISDYRGALFDKNLSEQYYDEEMFLLWSCDISGIQNFIYQISGSGALKQLRARSFYLEMLLEHSMDVLLERLDLSRCNLLYTGGGHAYAIFPNTESAKAALDGFAAELKEWLIKNFGIALFCACAYEPCCANDLKNQNADESNDKTADKKAVRYRALFQKLSAKLSEIKQRRYSAEDIAKFNFSGNESFDSTRECSECHRSDAKFSNDEEICELCGALKSISPELVKSDVFVISDEGELPLPFDAYLSCYTVDDYKKKQPGAVRIYTKNEWHTGDFLSTHIWMGNYTAEYPKDKYDSRFTYYTDVGAALCEGKGIKRLGVLRMDVDDLGAIFTQGIPDDKISVSRSATLSRMLSYFFKKEINDIVEKGNYRAQIIYSGGDDLFIIGNWNDVIYAAMDIRKALDDFTGNGVLTISAGIGMYDEHYPVARMAREVGVLEKKAKENPGKNSIALWTADDVFTWDKFQDNVLPMKEALERDLKSNDKGASFIYRMLSLLRDSDKISIPRLAYLLTRSFEDREEKSAEEIRTRMYKWATDEKTKKYFICALEWYVYSNRERG